MSIKTYTPEVTLSGTVSVERVRHYLEDKNDDDLLEIAVSQYRANKESLAGTYNWGTMLLDRSKPA